MSLQHHLSTQNLTWKSTLPFDLYVHSLLLPRAWLSSQGTLWKSTLNVFALCYGDTSLDIGKCICHVILINTSNTLAYIQPHIFHITIAKEMLPNELNTVSSLLYCPVRPVPKGGEICGNLLTTFF